MLALGRKFSYSLKFQAQWPVVVNPTNPTELIPCWWAVWVHSGWPAELGEIESFWVCLLGRKYGTTISQKLNANPLFILYQYKIKVYTDVEKKKNISWLSFQIQSCFSFLNLATKLEAVRSSTSTLVCHGVQLCNYPHRLHVSTWTDHRTPCRGGAPIGLALTSANANSSFTMQCTYHSC